MDIINTELNKAKRYLEAMKKAHKKTGIKEDCDNVLMHLEKALNQVKNICDSQCCVNHESKEAQALDITQTREESFNIEVSQLACKCPICSKEMDSQWVNHHHCTKCNEHFTIS